MVRSTQTFYRRRGRRAAGSAVPLVVALVTGASMGGCSLVRGTPVAAVPQDPVEDQTSASRPAQADRTESGPSTSASSTDNGDRAVTRTYEIAGESYDVWSDGAEYVERGIASWYGEELEGRPTASGEPFDPYGMTAAHRSLPLGTRVEVENLQNGRTVIVRVNDRGPFVDDRIIDLSLAAAQALGFRAQGTTRVEVRSLD